METVRALQRAVRHRGPDDEGFVCLGGVDLAPAVFGGADTPDTVRVAGLHYTPHGGEMDTVGASLVLAHRRLSIIDLSAAGHQPMCDAERRCWITYNGEIYNYVELREELRGLGHPFSTQSDTEVMLAAWRQWGRECLHRFNGMFAFVLLDRARRRLFAARDRFGVKPLYYWVSPDGLIAFASEIKQFMVMPGWRARVNSQRAYDFLAWGVCDHTDETLFEGVFQLRGGEALELDLAFDRPCRLRPGGRLPVHRWYELEGRAFSGTLEEAGREFRHLLTDSVRLRLRADVPVGSCLSGGLDSSSIVCVMNGLLREHNAHALQRTFSACATVKRFDEREFVDEVVRHTGTDAHYVYPSHEELFPQLDRITNHQDEPFGSTSIFAQWHVLKLAAENGVKVVLDGQGADEQLAGYHGFFGARYAGLLRGLRWLTFARETRAAKALHGHSASMSLQYALNGVLPEPLRQPLRRLAGRPANKPPWLDLATLRAEPRDPFRAVDAAYSSSVAVMSHMQLAATSLPMLLHWEDRDSMAHSVEAREPFLDYRLVEFVLGLPEEYKIAEGVTKRVLREGMRGVLPEKVRTRMDKLGFVTPEETWLREEGTVQFRKALRDSIDGSGGILRPNVLEVFDEMVEGRQPFSFLIWRLISFGTWMRVFGVRV